MMNWEQKKLVHNQIILDLAVRTLERDREQVDHLKSKHRIMNNIIPLNLVEEGIFIIN